MLEVNASRYGKGWELLKATSTVIKPPMLRKITIFISHLPYSELNPNSRCHWSLKNRAVQIAKAEIGWLSKLDWHDEKPMMRARISYEFHLKDHRKRDLDNLLASCKAYQDGLIEVGVIFYDDAEHLEMGKPIAVVTGQEEMIVSLEELPVKEKI